MVEAEQAANGPPVSRLLRRNAMTRPWRFSRPSKRPSLRSCKAQSLSSRPSVARELKSILSEFPSRGRNREPGPRSIIEAKLRHTMGRSFAFFIEGDRICECSFLLRTTLLRHPPRWEPRNTTNSSSNPNVTRLSSPVYAATAGRNWLPAAGSQMRLCHLCIGLGVVIAPTVTKGSM